MRHNEEEALLTATRESLCTATKTQRSQKQINIYVSIIKENSLAISQKVKHRITIGASNSSSQCRPPKIGSTVTWTPVYTTVIFYNQQKVQTTQMPIDRGVGEQNVVDPYLQNIIQP